MTDKTEKGDSADSLVEMKVKNGVFRLATALFLKENRTELEFELLRLLWLHPYGQELLDEAMKLNTQEHRPGDKAGSGGSACCKQTGG